MKKSRFSESQIIAVLRRNGAGKKVTDLCRELGISPATFYKWKASYGGSALTNQPHPSEGRQKEYPICTMLSPAPG